MSTLLLKKAKNKKAVKFLLAPRPQKDPLAADFEAPQNVLIPKDGRSVEEVRKELPELDPDVFVSEQESKVGMLERAHAANGHTFDPDILRAMSKDFDFNDPNNLLDDDFMNQAGGLIEEDEEMIDDDDLFEDEPTYLEVFNSAPKQQDDAKSMTNYSMSSSVMRLNNPGLQRIDDHFERLYEEKYADDDDIGSLEMDEVQGKDLLSDMNQIRQLKNEVKTVRKRNHGDDYEPEVVSDHHKNAIIGDDNARDEEGLVEVEIQRRENRIDCESILSYNSNLYNHPRLIVEPRRKMNSKSTIDGESMCDETQSDEGETIASSCASVLSKLSIRPPNETAEERRVRKKALRQYRQERRQQRKLHQQIFKAEKANVSRQQRLNQPVLKLA